jgi:hypothetical protein
MIKIVALFLTTGVALVVGVTAARAPDECPPGEATRETGVAF